MGVSVYILSIILIYVLFNLSKILKFVKKRMRLYEIMSKIDGPLSLPIIGTTFQFKLDAIGFSLQLYNWGMEYAAKGSSFARFWIGPHPLIVALTPEANKQILESNALIDKANEYDVFLPWLGTGLLLAGGDKWRQRRKMLTPSFHFNVLNDFQPVFDFQSKILLEQLEQNSKSATTSTIDAFPFIKRCALDIICETAMGTTVNAQINHNHPYVVAVTEMNKIAYEYQRMPWLWIKPISYLLGFEARHQKNLDIVLSFTREVIEKKTKEFEMTGKVESGKKKAFLDMLIEMKEEGGLGYEDIREEVDTFMFEGHDTTSAGIGWALWCLAHHPEYQELCHKELDEIFGHGSTRDCTVEDIKKMKYLEKCVKESLRLRPSVPQFARYVGEEVEIDGTILPPDCSLLISPAFIQNNPNTFGENHTTFDPERFSEEAISKRHAYSYIPFSAGPRNCIGQKFAMQEEKTVISWVLRKYRISGEIPMLDNLPLPETIMRPLLGFPLKFEPRF